MINKSEQTFLKKKLPMYIKLASSVSLVVGAMGVANAYAADAADTTEEIVVTGQRASIQSAQEVKKNANVVVDSIVAEDIGKLPDRSVTEALQRVPGVTVGRYTNNDAEHPAAEGSGVAIRGLSQVRAELNGRDIFSAASGRGLSFEDVPAELMYAVDTYKSPSADMIEGGLGGTVNLRTRMPFDSAGQQASVTIKGNYGDQLKETNGEYSGLYSNRWTTDAGEFGFLVDVSTSELASRSDQIYTRPYLPRTDIDSNKTVWISKGVDWRRNDYHAQRDGGYVALQWAPNDNTEVYLTAFESKHISRYDENAFFIEGYTGDVALVPTSSKNWVYDDKGALVSGDATVTNPANWGIDFGTSTRFAEGMSKTRDISTGVKWSPDDHWKFSADLQYVKSDATMDDFTLGVKVIPSSVRLDDLGTDHPSVSMNGSYMSNYANYNLGQEMIHLERNSADAKTGRFDAEYSFEDSIIKSVKAGFRYSQKSADNINTGYDWNTRYATWFTKQDWSGYDKNTIPKVSASEASKYLTLYSFKNFQRGDVAVPAAAYIYSKDAVKNFRATTDAVNGDPSQVCPAYQSWICGAIYPDWVGQSNLDNPDNGNEQTEKSSAVYVMTNYGFDDLSMPIDGNLGVRLIKTENIAHGHVIYSAYQMPDGSKPFYQPAANYDAENTYTHVLPSFNMRIKATDDLYVRFAASKAIWAPNFSDLKARMSLSVAAKDGVTTVKSINDLNFTLSQDSNPYLEPMTANQFDISTEWYFDDKGGMAHLALFSKQVEGFFRHGTSVFDLNGYSYSASWLANVGSGDIKGAEIGFNKFFDFLPAPFDGLGIETNITFIDSKSHVPSYVEAEDTDHSHYGQLPIEQLSKNSFNLVGMYEKDGISARLAYTWRSKYLIGNDANGFKETNGSDQTAWWRLPVYNDDYGQLDASIGYTFMDNYTVTLEASNLLKEKTVGIMDQNKAGDHVAYSYAQDARYALSFRAKF